MFKNEGETVAKSAVEVNVQLVVCDDEESGGGVGKKFVVVGGSGEGDERATSTTANSTRKLSRFACPHVANYMTVSPYPASTTFIFFRPLQR